MTADMSLTLPPTSVRIHTPPYLQSIVTLGSTPPGSDVSILVLWNTTAITTFIRAPMTTHKYPQVGPLMSPHKTGWEGSQGGARAHRLYKANKVGHFV